MINLKIYQMKKSILFLALLGTLSAGFAQATQPAPAKNDKKPATTTTKAAPTTAKAAPATATTTTKAAPTTTKATTKATTKSAPAKQPKSGGTPD